RLDAKYSGNPERKTEHNGPDASSGASCRCAHGWNGRPCHSSLTRHRDTRESTCPCNIEFMTKITPDVIEAHQLTASEYDKILRLLGREPTLTELGIFSIMWSEHCSYKSTRVHLKKLPSEGKHILQGPGENAGIIDIGNGLAIAFKIESH